MLCKLCLFTVCSLLIGEDILLSIPRTGTNWVISSFQFLTGRPAYFFQAYSGQVPSLKQALYVTHNSRYLKGMDTSENNLILIIRDYKERQMRDDVLDRESFTLFQILMRNLELYDQWDDEHRFIIYYEDMVTKPWCVMKDLLDFLGESDEQVSTYEDNIEEFRSATLMNYHKHHKTADIANLGSCGREVNYYTKMVQPEVLRKFDKDCKARNPRLWEKYLSRYATDK